MSNTLKSLVVAVDLSVGIRWFGFYGGRLMRRKLHNALCFERLNDRIVFSANAGVCGVPAPPPPPEIDAEVLANYSTNHIRVRDQAGGTFVAIERRNAPQNGDATPFLTGDFNGDGVTDLLGVDAADDWWLQLNDGTRLFEVPVGEGLAESETLGSGDFNSDGRLDVISYDPSGELWVSVNEPDGFDHQRWSEFRNPRGWSELHLGDFNGDGRQDVLGGEAGGYWWLAQNNGGTDFDNYRWGRYQDFTWKTTVTGDFNGDQIDDIAGLAPDHTWWVWEGSSEGMLPAKYFGHWKMRDSFANIQVGDFNGDQRDDVLGRSLDGQLWVGTSTPTGFNSWSWATGWLDTAEWSMNVLDIDNDGLDDQVGYASDNTWWYALSNGNTFRNGLWHKGGPGDFVVKDFKASSPVDLIDSMPVGGIDTRDLELTAEISADDQVVIRANRPIGITELTLQSSSGGLITTEESSPAPFGTYRHNTPWRVEVYNAQHEPVLLEDSWTLDVGWNRNHRSLRVSARVEGSAYLTLPVRVTSSVGSNLEPPSTSAVNQNYFDSIPLDAFTHSNQGFSSLGPESVVPTAEGYASIVDGRIALNGTFHRIAGMEVLSAGGYLSLETIEIPPIPVPVPLANPFSPADGVIVVNEPGQIVIGVLGADKRVNLEGTTLTSILYTGPLDQANEDLTIQIGTGDSPPEQLQVGEASSSA